MRRVFLAFGYNQRDAWVKDLVVPMVEAFGVEAATGEEVPGQALSPAIQELIRNSDALIAFLTRRDQLANGSWTTHPWVLGELTHGQSSGLARLLPVVEEGVDYQPGIVGNLQRLAFQEARRDECLVALARAIGQWTRAQNIRLQLLPPAFVEAVRPQVPTPGFRCTYQLMEGSRTRPEQPVQIMKIKGGLFIDLIEVPPQALVKIQIAAAGRSWSSDFESVDAVSVALAED